MSACLWFDDKAEDAPGARPGEGESGDVGDAANPNISTACHGPVDLGLIVRLGENVTKNIV